MQDAWIFIPVLVLALLLAAPAVRRWFSNDERRNLVDHDQNISVDQKDGLPGWYQTNFRLRRMPRGRRHRPPQAPSADRVRREPPASTG